MMTFCHVVVVLLLLLLLLAKKTNAVSHCPEGPASVGHSTKGLLFFHVK